MTKIRSVVVIHVRVIKLDFITCSILKDEGSVLGRCSSLIRKHSCRTSNGILRRVSTARRNVGNCMS